MRGKMVRRTGLAALCAALVISIPVTQAHAAGGVGTVTGHYLTSDGQPEVGVGVYVFLDNNFGGSGTTDSSGAFTITGIPAGTYVVQFNNPNGIQEYAPNAPAPEVAGHYDVTAGGTVVIEEHATPTATISGTVYAADGVTPAGYGFLHVVNTQYNLDYVADIAANGHYSVLLGAGVDYRIQMTRNDDLIQWFPQAAMSADAGLYQVTGGEDQVVDVTYGATATLSGTFRDGTGQPVEGEADVILPDGSTAIVGYVSIIDGTWSVPVLAGGDYIVRFSAYGDGHVEYAYGASDAASATHFAPAAGETVTIDEVVGAGPGTSSITVHAKDATTGASVLGFCAQADGQEGCTGNGALTLTGIHAGDRSLEVYPTNLKYLQPAPVVVPVADGADNPVTVTLKLGATIKATIVDAVTGVPVAGACVLAFTPGVTLWPGGNGPCSGADGIVRVYRLTTGSYSLFVTPPDGSGYGAQWVGKTAGQGTESGARLVVATEGKTVTTGNIKLDRAGTITGVVTGSGAHTPLAGAIIGPNAITPGLGEIGNDVVTDATGHFTITNLGPYAWPLFEMATGYPAQWSGGVGNRYSATKVSVVADATVTANLALKLGTTIAGTAETSGGPAADAQIVAFNATTGDAMGLTFTDASGHWSMRVIPGQNVKFRYVYSAPASDTSVVGWLGGATQATATTVKITSPGQTNVDITVG